MHRAIGGITMIFDVIGKLTLEKGIHAGSSLQPWRGSTQALM
jgi:hypothetical protein